MSNFLKQFKQNYISKTTFKKSANDFIEREEVDAMKEMILVFSFDCKLQLYLNMLTHI